MANNTKFTIGQGETLKILLNLRDTTNVNPLDITTIAFTGSVRETYSANKVSANFEVEKLSPGSSGSLYVTLLASDTATLEAQDYVYDLLMVSGSTVRRILEGQLIVRPSVTRL